ncbi:MAG: sensor histidine kinase [Bacillota bacterium]
MLKRKTLLLFIIIIFSLLTYFVTFENAHEEQKRIIANNLELTMNVSKDIEQLIKTKFLTMEMVADFLDGYWNVENYNIDSHLSYLLYRDEYLRSLVIVNEQGEILKQMHKQLDKREQDKLFKSYLLPYLQYPLLGERYISDLIHDKNISEEVITLGIPLFESGEITGAIFQTVSTQAFQDLIQDVKVGEQGYALIRDSLGDTIAHPKIKEIRGKNYKFLDVSLLPKSDHVIKVSSFDNQVKYMTYMPLQIVNWMVFIMQPINEYKTSIYTIWLKNGSLLALLFVFMYLLYNLEQKEKRLLQTHLNNERLEVVAQVAAGLAHEIKNPLVPIKGFVQLEKLKPASTLGENSIRLILDEIGRIEKILNEFMSLARTNKTEFLKLDIGLILNDIISLIQVEADKRNTIIKWDTEKTDKEVPILGNENHLKQVLLNIIKNAVEAVKDEGLIEIGLRLARTEVCVSIKDNGSGMSPEVLRKVGTPFYSTKESGTGMGLAVSERIIKNHNGRMEIISQEKKGTQVFIYLPLYRN